MSDLIDRQEAIKALKGLPIYWADEEALLEPKDAIFAIENLPTAEPKRGKWTKENACEFCGYKPWYERDIHTLNFCSHCGADMRGEKNETD